MQYLGIKTTKEVAKNEGNVKSSRPNQPETREKRRWVGTGTGAGVTVTLRTFLNGGSIRGR